MKYNYSALYNKNATFLRAHPTLQRAIKWGNIPLTAIFPIAYALVLVNSFFLHPLPTEESVRILLFPCLTLVTVSVLRLFVERPRPYEETGAGITPLLPKKSIGNSFPSRHVACATVIAWTLTSQFLAVGILFFVLVAAMGYLRFSIGWHYPLDIVASLLLGTAFGIFTII